MHLNRWISLGSERVLTNFKMVLPRASARLSDTWKWLLDHDSVMGVEVDS